LLKLRLRIHVFFIVSFGVVLYCFLLFRCTIIWNDSYILNSKKRNVWNTIDNKIAFIRYYINCFFKFFYYICKKDFRHFLYINSFCVFTENRIMLWGIHNNDIQEFIVLPRRTSNFIVIKLL